MKSSHCQSYLGGNPMRRSISLVIVLGTLCAFVLAAGAKPKERSQITLGALQGALADLRASRPVPEPLRPLLTGYQFHWVLELGGGLHLVVISRNLGGALLAFRPDGSLRARKDTQEITWLQLFDFDEDGRAEIILDEIDGRGTAILLRNFHIYRLKDNSIVQVWEGTSYHRKEPPPRGEHPATFELARAFIRCEPSGAGIPETRLLHVIEGSQGIRETGSSRQAYSFSKGKFQRIAWPDR
ncbi:MAG: hypothetical protein ACJ76N_07660 [Thermoanaerobaculia bacterium]